jgi:sec-independent protein translocase protein TatB
MFDMSWGEVMLIGGVALIVIGPKELPKALRTVGQVTSKLKRMAYEFHSQFNEAMREADLEDARREVEGINRTVSNTMSGGFNPLQTIRDEIKSAVERPAEPKPTTAAIADATAQLEAERREEPVVPEPPPADPALPDPAPPLPPDVPELAPPQDPALKPEPAPQAEPAASAPPIHQPADARP